jgi:hypothetical protein
MTKNIVMDNPPTFEEVLRLCGIATPDPNAPTVWLRHAGDCACLKGQPCNCQPIVAETTVGRLEAWRALQN